MKHSILIIAIIFGLVLASTFAWTGNAQTPDQTQISLDNARSLVESRPDDQNNVQPGRPDIQLHAQPSAESVLQAANEVQRTVSVSGSGQAEAQPDQATVRLGVQTEAESAEQALADNNAKMQSLLDSLQQAGVASEDIQTQAIQLQPRYDQQPEQQGTGPIVTGYTATNIVEVKIKNLDTLGELLDAAVQAGGNTVEGINFEVSDSAALLDQAREAAMQDARHKAEHLVSLADATLGNVLTINEFSNTPRPVARAGVAMAEAQAVPIAPGTQSIQIDVQVTWLLNE
jgi:uncharacterized protein YggE